MSIKKRGHRSTLFVLGKSVYFCRRFKINSRYTAAKNLLLLS
nr:MAG TPA: hypothetical protein [Bacteriophage sp.]